MEEIDKVLRAEQERLAAEIKRLQDRSASIATLLGSTAEPAPEPAAPKPRKTKPAKGLAPSDADQAERVYKLLVKAGSAGMSRGEVATAAGIAPTKVGPILGVLRVQKRAKMKGAKRNARWFAK